MKRVVIFLLALLVTSFVLCDEKAQAATAFQVPQPSDPSKVVLLDTFEKDPKSNGWVESQNSKYASQEWKWSNAPGPVVGFAEDKGLLAVKDATHYAIAKAVNVDTKGKDFVFQYEVKYDKSVQCSGSYVKLLSKTDDLDLTAIDDKTPYVIMFGPDYCNPTDKVHFIFRHFNPKKGIWEEKHLKNPPKIKNDHFSHLYTLIVRTDNSFEILIDNESASTGSLLTDFEPSVNPPREIDDPEDKKPADWVDEEFIDDATATKPDDWDENAPLEIPDPEDKKPDTWQDNAPEKIEDPEAKKPADWNDEEDGKWEAPLIDNPACQQYGCGEWKPRMIRNPNYKGKWKAPKVKNPLYKGEWKAKQIPNPDFFEDLHPHNFPVIGAVAIEILANQGNILFDNILITHDETVAKEFAKQSWAKKLDLQKTQAPAATNANPGDNPIAQIIEKAQEIVMQYPIPVLSTVLAIMITIPFICCRLCASGEEEKPAAASNVKVPESVSAAEQIIEESNKEETTGAQDEKKDEPAPRKRNSKKTPKDE